MGGDIDGRIFIKIGIANEPERRLRELQTGFPCDLKLLGYFKMSTESEARKVESSAHKLLNDHRQKGEWFKFERFSDFEIVFRGFEGLMELICDDNDIIWISK